MGRAEKGLMGSRELGPVPWVLISTRCVWCAMLAKMVGWGPLATPVKGHGRLGGWKGARGRWEITGPKGEGHYARKGK